MAGGLQGKRGVLGRARLSLPSQVVVALCQRLRVAHDLLHVLLLGPREGEQAVLHAEVVFADDVQLQQHVRASQLTSVTLVGYDSVCGWSKVGPCIAITSVWWLPSPYHT